jgi:hypothetical protein
MIPKEVNGFAYLCTALKRVDSPAALSVLDPATGKFLEHCQLCCNLCYKTKWDTSYTDVSRLERYCTNVLLARLTKVRR